jgi:transcriptional regulator with XRE-family HTH domain
VRIPCHHTLVLRWEHGEREPTLHDLPVLARILEVTLGDLLDDVELPSIRTWSSRAHDRGERLRLGGRLRLARERRDLSVWDVYVASGISGGRLLRIERGNDPSLAEACQLARLYELAIEDLVMPSRVDSRQDIPTVWGSKTPSAAVVGPGIHDAKVRVVTSPNQGHGASSADHNDSNAISIAESLVAVDALVAPVDTDGNDLRSRSDRFDEPRDARVEDRNHVEQDIVCHSRNRRQGGRVPQHEVPILRRAEVKAGRFLDRGIEAGRLAGAEERRAKADRNGCDLFALGLASLGRQSSQELVDVVADGL